MLRVVGSSNVLYRHFASTRMQIFPLFPTLRHYRITIGQVQVFIENFLKTDRKPADNVSNKHREATTTVGISGNSDRLAATRIVLNEHRLRYAGTYRSQHTKKFEPTYKPGSVEDSYSSTSCVTTGL